MATINTETLTTYELVSREADCPEKREKMRKVSEIYAEALARIRESMLIPREYL